MRAEWTRSEVIILGVLVHTLGTLCEVLVGRSVLVVWGVVVLLGNCCVLARIHEEWRVVGVMRTCLQDI